jgi:hypothetical protein
MGDEWSVSRSVRFNLKDIAPGTYPRGTIKTSSHCVGTVGLPLYFFETDNFRLDVKGHTHDKRALNKTIKERGASAEKVTGSSLGNRSFGLVFSKQQRTSFSGRQPRFRHKHDAETPLATKCLLRRYYSNYKGQRTVNSFYITNSM